MLFSGKFGSGKTYFLNHYFEQEKNKSKYLKIYTQPSAYYHAADGDVLGYLKYDILACLLQQTDLEEFQGEELGTFGLLLEMMKEKGLVGPSLMAIAILSLFFAGPASAFGALQISKLITTSYEGGEFYSKARKRLEEEKASRNADGNTRFQEYQALLAKQKDSLFEESAINDLITALLKHHQTKVRKDKDGKHLPPIQAVLIVDDLDRMLPDACLGFLNMLSTHVQPSNAKGVKDDWKNLYSFDKVIVVGDLTNIEAFIRLTYGENFDRTGYIEKIIGGCVFSYDASKKLKDLLLKVVVYPFIIRDLGENVSIPKGYRESFEPAFEYIFSLLVSAHVFTTRDVLRVAQLDIRTLIDEPKVFHIKNGKFLNSNNSYLVFVAGILSLFYGDYSKAVAALKAASARLPHIAATAHPSVVAELLLMSSGDIPTDVDGKREPFQINIGTDKYFITVEYKDDPFNHTNRIFANMSIDNAKLYELYSPTSKLLVDILCGFSEITNENRKERFA